MSKLIFIITILLEKHTILQTLKVAFFNFYFLFLFSILSKGPNEQLCKVRTISILNKNFVKKKILGSTKRGPLKKKEFKQTGKPPQATDSPHPLKFRISDEATKHRVITFIEGQGTVVSFKIETFCYPFKVLGIARAHYVYV